MSIFSDDLSDEERDFQFGRMNREERDFFNGKCPYTRKPCEDWHCEWCDVEQKEREMMDAFDDDDEREADE